MDPVTDFSNYFSRSSAGKLEFTHNRAVRYPLLPFITKLTKGKEDASNGAKLDFKSFEGHIGYCYRSITGKTLSRQYEDGNMQVQLKSDLLDEVQKRVQCQDQHREKLRAIVDSQFFNGNELVKYSVESQAYLYWKTPHSGLKNIARFVREIFIDEDIATQWLNKGASHEHLLHRLLNEALPPLEQRKPEQVRQETAGYQIINLEVIDLFKTDFEYLVQDKKSFLNESEQLFKFYYFFYIGQLALTLNEFFNEEKEHQLYMTLESESVSEGRRSNESGWKKLEVKVNTLMSHGVCLDLLHHLPLIAQQGGLDYRGLRILFQQLDAQQHEQLLGQIKELTRHYTEAVTLKDNWSDFDQYFRNATRGLMVGNELESAVIDLFFRIEYQFDKSDRASKRKAFASWYVSFCKENFLKNRGRNGYSLNLSTDMLLFLTKLCVGQHKKIRLNELITAFRQRGLYFDDHTQRAMLAIYEKINLIEKKSDSGDAQYIRAVL